MQLPVACTEDVLEVMAMGAANRAVAETRMNERSSRSHSVFTCTIEATERADTGITSTRTSKLNLIDLAGGMLGGKGVGIFGVWGGGS